MREEQASRPPQSGVSTCSPKVRTAPLRVCANIVATQAFPKRGKGDRRRWWMRMSALALRGNALAFDCLRGAFPLSVADTGGASPVTTAKRCVNVLAARRGQLPYWLVCRVVINRGYYPTTNSVGPPPLARGGLVCANIMSSRITNLY